MKAERWGEICPWKGKLLRSARRVPAAKGSRTAPRSPRTASEQLLYGVRVGPWEMRSTPDPGGVVEAARPAVHRTAEVLEASQNGNCVFPNIGFKLMDAL